MTRRVLGWGAAISIVGVAVLGLCFHIHGPAMYYLGWFLSALFPAVVLLQLVVASNGIFQRVFELRILVYLGKVSYGLYLWHYPIFRLVEIKMSELACGVDSQRKVRKTGLGGS